MTTQYEQPSLARRAAEDVAWRAAQHVARGALAAKGGAVVALVVVALLAVLALVLVCAMVGAAFQTSAATWPVPVATDAAGGYRASGWAITSGFGWRDDPRRPGVPEFHDGVDLAGPALCHRCPAAAMFDATVTYVGWDVPEAGRPETTGGGQVVQLESGQEDVELLYAHLEPYRLYVQLQGRIDDPHGRYDAYADYQPLGQGELLPDLADGEISMWCARDTPRFRATRLGPGTLLFTYDRPASCTTSVTWGRRGGGWVGWTPDDPPATEGRRAELGWSTPVDIGRSAGDVALRFRAHLAPPPPPPTATPVVSGTLPLLADKRPTTNDQRSAPQIANRKPQTSGPGRCERLDSGGTHCTWALAEIPAADAPAFRADRGMGAAGVRAQALSQDATLEPPTATPAAAPPATPTAPTAAPIFLVLTASSGSPAIGEIFSFSASVFSDGVAPRAIAVGADMDPLLELLDAGASGGTCHVASRSASCDVRAHSGAPATLTFAVRARQDAPPGAHVTARVMAQADGETVSRAITVALSIVRRAPDPWPPPTQALQTTVRPTAEGGPGPSAPLAPESPPTAPCYRAVVAALSRQGARYSQGGALPGDPRGPDGLPLPRTGPHSFDCSGLVWWAYAQAGVPVGLSTYQQLDDGVPLACTLDDLRGPATRCWAPGDLVFLRYPQGQHVAIYAGAGLFMDCFNHRVGCVLHDVARDPFYRAHFLQARRIVSGCEEMTLDPGAPVPPPLDGTPQGDAAGMCVAEPPTFSGPVEMLRGCGPPVRPGDKVFQLDSVVGFVGLTGATSGPHLHLGMRVRSYDGSFRTTDVCTASWLRGRTPPPEASCWTDMADPLDFLPRALGGETLPGGTPIPAGAPYQLPPPGHPGALAITPAAGGQPAGQYWSPHADGGRYGGGGAIAWLRNTSCTLWRGWSWCS